MLASLCAALLRGCAAGFWSRSLSFSHCSPRWGWRRLSRLPPRAATLLPRVVMTPMSSLLNGWIVLHRSRRLPSCVSPVEVSESMKNMENGDAAVTGLLSGSPLHQVGAELARVMRWSHGPWVLR